MNYLELIENEVDVPAIWMRDIKKRCNECCDEAYVKKQWDFMQG